MNVFLTRLLKRGPPRPTMPKLQGEMRVLRRVDPPESLLTRSAKDLTKQYGRRMTK